MSILFVIDATHQNINSIPNGALAALYTTGSLDIKATVQDFANHPKAIHICQDHGSDITADMLDMESGAATPGDCVQWLPKARGSFNANQRSGQRWPGIYASLNSLTPLANALLSAKLSNVPLWVADWGLPQATAVNDIVNASGPWPIVGMQIKNQGVNDFSVFTDSWITHVSGMVTLPATPPGQWLSPSTWTWAEVAEMGLGLDGKFHAFLYDAAANGWSKVV